MSSALKFAASVLALGGLLYQAAANATDLAEQPLKASVLAKPNVIFGMDDSGSMDFEVVAYGNDGSFWWNTTTMSGWGVDNAHPNPALRTVTAPWFHEDGSQSGAWRKMAYLFPNGTGVGRRGQSDGSNSHFAILPTSEFAFMRWSGAYKDGTGVWQMPPSDPATSAFHNPIYYNPLVTYQPWAPAQLGTGGVTPANASTTAAKSHPMNGLGTTYASGTGTTDLTTTIAASTNSNEVFTAFGGMTLPAGAQRRLCDMSNNCGSNTWDNVGASDVAASTTNITRVAVTYFPATYWVKEPCTVDTTSSVMNRACTTAPDGSTLKRYEIKPTTASYPSGRSYAAELQNFANWFQYYRKRKLMLAAAMGETMETLTGMRLGVVRFNSLSNATMYDADAAAASSNRLRVAGLFYENPSSGGTPTRETLRFIGEQYKRTDMTSGKYNVIQYACQRNNAFIVTDGFANASSVSVPAYVAPKSQATYGTGAPYEQIHPGTLADLALRYYTNNPRTDMTAGQLPPTPKDANKDLHMNTYGLSLGPRGTLFLGESSPEPTSTSAWPNPTTNYNPTSVDDLWHATINGRGKMYLANTPEETAVRIRAGLDDIKSQVGAQTSIAVSSFNLLASDGQAYEASYNPAGWIGDLTASAVDKKEGTIAATPTWSAGTLLNARAWGTRIVVTTNGTTGLPFTEGNIGAAIATSPFTNAGLVDYLRGNRAEEGETYRKRTSLLGSVLNAEPVVDITTGTVYLASGEGMLHAFDTATGTEQWAYVPYAGLAEIGKTAAREYTFKTKLDGTPVVGKYTDAGARMLIAGMGAAGRRYYAIDVTSPKGLTEAQAAANVKWTFPSPADTTHYPYMGYTVGRAAIVKTASDGYVALVTSGYDNGTAIGDGKGRLWMLNAATGAVIHTFVTTEGAPGAEAGLAHVNAYRNDDGTARYVYGGDLLGNVWKFDLTARTTTRLTTLRDASNNPQPVTTRPQLTRIKNKPVVLIGTGRLLDIGDFGSSAVQTVYGISDGAAIASVRASTAALTINASNEIKGKVDWATQRGWHLDLASGQHVNVDPKLALGWLYVNGNKAGGMDCSQSAYGYKIWVEGGTTDDEVIGGFETLSTTANVMSPVLVQAGDRVFRWQRFNDGKRKEQEEIDKRVIPARKNAWRDISR